MGLAVRAAAGGVPPFWRAELKGGWGVKRGVTMARPMSHSLIWLRLASADGNPTRLASFPMVVAAVVTPDLHTQGI